MLAATFSSRILAQMTGQLLKNESLAPYTSWRVGGPAEYIYIPENLDDLVNFIKLVPHEMPIVWLGLGSNSLIRDGGIDGVAIITQGALGKISQPDALVVRAEAGVSCAQIARYSARLGLTGLEFMAGIPGTVGGALSMNAGCYGGETWQTVCKVETLNRLGEINTRTSEQFDVSYRHVKGHADEWFLAGHFELSQGDKKISLEKIRTMLEKRNMAQPTSWPSGGSVFRNPEGNHAAKLIESCGLKGLRVGNACVSDKHANFIINEGDAKASDIEELIQQIMQIVEKEKGIRLIPEVCMIGKYKQG